MKDIVMSQKKLLVCYCSLDILTIYTRIFVVFMDIQSSCWKIRLYSLQWGDRESIVIIEDM